MGVSNCARCGRIFNYVAGQRICESCRKELEKDFQKVKDYIRNNPNKGIREVSDECEVSEKQIKNWVREERLEFSKGAGVLNCETCGAPISTGRFCDKCKAQMTGNFNASIKSKQDANQKMEPQADHSKDGMRFIKN